MVAVLFGSATVFFRMRSTQIRKAKATKPKHYYKEGKMGKENLTPCFIYFLAGMSKK